MSQRLNRMRVLLKAQEQMQRNAQRAVDKASKELDYLRQKEMELLSLMSDGDPLLVNALMNSHVNQIRQVNQRKNDMQDALETLKSETRKQAVFMEAVKRMASVLEQEERSEAEKKNHQEIIEQTAYQSEGL
ncbi:hypothetical protein SAMN04515647_2403 [Cohaesibacter sp. ES.047]|uniref:hypothetical protein n=1 Tax=Cohaesibacter sp. ES.047 TaxID=1798205 RepID=UPI000BC0AF47|nr:hypothetical protein [Cohaesibacter sp. ES.047]SNY92158.1 hypothetical protein SAMN04515647_2403 [Cohaesibacter sp. ES.047]